MRGRKTEVGGENKLRTAERRSYWSAAAAKRSTETSPSRWTSRHDPPPSRLASPAKNKLSRLRFRFWSEKQRRGSSPHLVRSVHAPTKVSVKAGSSASSKTTSHLYVVFVDMMRIRDSSRGKGDKTIREKKKKKERQAQIAKASVGRRNTQRDNPDRQL